MCFAGNAGAGIRHFDFDAAIVRGSANFQHSSGGHGITRVQEKVQEDLLQLVGRPADGRKRFAKLLHHLNMRGFQGVGHKRQRLFHDAVTSMSVASAAPVREKIEQIVDDFAGAEGLLDDFFNDSTGAGLLPASASPTSEYSSKSPQGRVYFVSDTGREKPKRGPFFCLRHLLFHALPLGPHRRRAKDAPMRSFDLLTRGVIETFKVSNLP